MEELAVDVAVRDHTFARAKNMADNHFCIDCARKKPTWASVHLGIFLCYQCAAKHRQYSVKYSFIRSTNLDSWTQKQLLYIEHGGNRKATDFFKKCGMLSQSNKQIDYRSDLCLKYKSILNAEVENALAISQGDQPVPVPDQEMLINLPQAKIEQEEVKEQPIVIEKPVTFQTGSKKKKFQSKKLDVDNYDAIKCDGGLAPQDLKHQPKYEPTLQSEQSTTTTTQHFKQQQMGQEATAETLKCLKEKNVKAVSSDDFKVQDSAAISSHLQTSYGEKKAISSSELFGQNEDSPTINSKIGEAVSDVWSSAGQKFSSWKDRMSQMIKK